MEDIRARAEQALFGQAEPVRVGRYVLLGRIAGGGMGIVYGAYDPELRRQVALKVLHPRQHGSDTARQRMLLEARALAKLDHPAVVKLHDVLTHAGEVVLVMELIDGVTLATWERERPHTWREVCAVYARAGEGLAAAHGVGVIHRDFKPANVIVSPDGRVRVLDFGLARMPGDGELPPAREASAAGADADDLTATGDVVGTLGYTAPEVLAGASATMAADQFAFCVALHRAVEGVPPFAGTDLPTLEAAIRAGVIARNHEGRAVPAWLRAIIGRGLSAAPDARYATMRDLLHELARPRGLRRWRSALVGGTALALSAGLAIAVSARSGPQPRGPTCDGGENAVRAVWNSQERTRLATAMAAAATPYARSTEDRVFGMIDTYAERLVDVSRAGCRLNRVGLRSDAIYERQLSCLAERRGALAASLDVLRTEAALDHAVDVVAELPAIEPCEDLLALAGEQLAPTNDDQRQAVAATRDRLGRAAALDRASRTEAALSEATATLADADATRYRPVIVEANLLLGRVLLVSGRCAEALPRLRRAEDLALEIRDLRRATEAAARRFYCQGLATSDRTALDALFVEARFYERLSADDLGDQFARPLLLNNLGSVHMSRGQRDAAYGYYQAAAADLEGVTDIAPELENVFRNLSMLTADTPAREAIARRAWERLRDRLGEAHPHALNALDAYGRYVDDPARAHPLVTRECELRGKFHPTDLNEHAHCLLARALVTEELGLDVAGDYAALGRLAAAATNELIAYRDLARAQLARAHGDHATAIAGFTAIVARYRSSPEWWEAQWVARASLGAGLTEQARHRAGAARAHLVRAVAAYQSLTVHNEEAEWRQGLAAARAALAPILRASGDAATADRLLADARAFWLAAGPETYRARLGR